LKEIKLMDTQEKTQEVMNQPEASREWLAPKLTVLSVGATAGGPVPNTEAYNYMPAGSH
jgi:hypothetical protein